MKYVRVIIIKISERLLFTRETHARIYKQERKFVIWQSRVRGLYIWEVRIYLLQTHLTYVSPVCGKEPLLSSINDRGCVSGRFQVTQRNRRGVIGRPALTEKHLSAGNAARCRRQQLSIASILRSLILSRSPQLADPLRRLHYLLAAAPYRFPWRARRTSWIPFQPRTIGVLRVTSAPLEVALVAPLPTWNPPRVPPTRPAERCNAIRHAKENFSRCPSTSMPIAFVRGSPRLRFPRRHRLLPPRGLHAGFTRDRWIPEKEIRGRAASPLLTQCAVKRGNTGSVFSSYQRGDRWKVAFSVISFTLIIGL